MKAIKRCMTVDNRKVGKNMRKLRSILTGIIALNMCFALVSCGDDSSDAGEVSEPSVSQAADSVASTAESAADESKEESVPAETTPDPEPVNVPVQEVFAPEEYVYHDVTPETDENYSEKYGYYDLLNAEYEKYGISAYNYSYSDGLMSVSKYYDKNEDYPLYPASGTPYYHDGKLYFLDYDETTSSRNLIVYDINTDTRKEQSLGDCIIICFVNGRLLLFDEKDGKGTLRVYNVVKLKTEHTFNLTKTEGVTEKIRITDSGTLLYCGETLSINALTDGIKFKKIPSLKMDGEEVTQYSLVGSYKNKLYFSCKEPKSYELVLYVFDTSSLKWSKVKTAYPYVSGYSYCVGKYLFATSDDHITSCIIDMESGKQMGGNLLTKGYDYYGGDSHMYVWRWQDDTATNIEKVSMSKIKLPINSTQPDKNTKEHLDIEYEGEIMRGSYSTNYLSPVNDKYYVACDFPNVYLSTYEEGKSGHKLIYTITLVE